MSAAGSIDTIVVGGGVVGMSIAFGLARGGERVRLLDEGDDAFRAARGNFGLVWVQGKGAGKPAYARWSVGASRLWAAMAQELTGRTGIDLQLDQSGGVALCLDEAEMAERLRLLTTVAAEVGEPYPFEMLDAAAIRELFPHAGPDVVGGSFGPLDGHVSPLRLLRALASALTGLGAEIQPGQSVTSIAHRHGAFHVQTGDAVHVAPKIVLAAGLGNRHLAPMVGLEAPVSPVRGQVMITERVQPFMNLPTGTVRQTGDGGVQIGESKEEAGFDDSTGNEVLARIAERAVRCFPILANVNVVRSWGALRVMTPDGYPIYQASSACPGAFIVTCHSGITLAPQHAGPIADWIRGAPEPDLLSHFKVERFHV